MSTQPGPHDHPPDSHDAAAARRTLLTGRRDELDRYLAGVRMKLVDSLIKGLLVVALLLVPASLSRSSATGWLPLYGEHVLLGAAAVLLFFSRNALRERTKAAALVAIFWAVGLVSLLGLGLAGTGIWWLVISSLLVSLLYSVRAGMIAMALVVVAIVGIGSAFCLGYLHQPFESAKFLSSPMAWVIAGLGATLMPLVVFRAVAVLNASTIALLSETGEQREQIRELAIHDELTGVPTFTLALDRLEQALRAIPRSGRNVGLLFVDLDGFKSINDSLGHEAGDSVLVMVAKRLRLNVRVEDTVARIGGDEFLVILTGVHTGEELVAVAQKLQRVVGEPMYYREQEVQVACSIGAAFVSDYGRSAEEVIRAADAAMYEAKRAGRNLVRLAPDAASEEAPAI
jgi:diguanylate cyclase (GGDEF)-like protein